MITIWPRSATPDYPGERLIVCRNPAPAHHRAAKRQDSLAPTEVKLAKITTHIRGKKPYTAAQIRVKVGKILGALKMGRNTSPSTSKMGISRTGAMTAGQAVQAYKNLANGGEDFQDPEIPRLGYPADLSLHRTPGTGPYAVMHAGRASYTVEAVRIP